MTEFLYLSEPWLDHIYEKITGDSVKKIKNGIDHQTGNSYEAKARWIGKYFEDDLDPDSLIKKSDYLMDVLPMRYTIFRDYQSSVAYFGNDYPNTLALIGSAKGFLRPVKEIEDSEAAGGFYGMVQINLLAEEPDDEACEAGNMDNDLFYSSLCQAIEKVPGPEMSLQFLARKRYLKKKNGTFLAVGLPVFVAFI